MSPLKPLPKRQIISQKPENFALSATYTGAVPGVWPKIFVRFPQSPFLYDFSPAGNTEHIFIVT